MRYDDREKPALVTALNLLGWLAIFVAAGLAVVRSGYYQPPLPAPRVAWAEIISTAFGGILLFCFAGIIRVFRHPGAPFVTALSIRIISMCGSLVS